MAAAAHGLAVGVEQDQFQVGEALAFERLRQPQPQPLVAEGGGQLPDKPAGIGKAELHRQLALGDQADAIGGALQGLLEHRLAADQGFGRLEQGRNLDQGLDAVQPGEVEGDQQSVKPLSVSAIRKRTGEAASIYLAISAMVMNSCRDELDSISRSRNPA